MANNLQWNAVGPNYLDWCVKYLPLAVREWLIFITVWSIQLRFAWFSYDTHYIALILTLP